MDVFLFKELEHTRSKTGALALTGITLLKPVESHGLQTRTKIQRETRSQAVSRHDMDNYPYGVDRS